MNKRRTKKNFTKTDHTQNDNDLAELLNSRDIENTLTKLQTKDSVVKLFSDLEKDKPRITDMIVIFYNEETNSYGWQITPETRTSLLTWLLESTKLDILRDED